MSYLFQELILFLLAKLAPMKAKYVLNQACKRYGNNLKSWRTVN